MRKVYSLSDRIKATVNDITVYFRPLSYQEKSEIQAAMVSGGVKGAIDGACNALKTALVDVQGLQNADGSTFKYDSERFDDILNLPESPILTKAALNLLNHVPEVFVDPETNEKLKGIEIVKGESSGKKQ